MHKDWECILCEEFNKDYFKNIQNFLKEQENMGKIIYPNKKNIFKCLDISPKEIKVVILGQDPYHGENQANGLAFSVSKNVKLPPSLRNIFKEIEEEYDVKMSKKNGDLTPWAKQGVLLLNTILTVEKSIPSSHKNIGWSIFTDKIIQKISENFEKKIFLLWGSHAIKKYKLIDEKKHLILTSNHPSPLSAYRGFFGNNHFKKANDYLIENNESIIDWKISD